MNIFDRQQQVAKVVEEFLDEIDRTAPGVYVTNAEIAHGVAAELVERGIAFNV